MDVQVVGRLVQDQQVGRREQQPRQYRPSALPARKLRDRAVEVVGVKAQPGQGLADARFVGVAAAALELVLQLAIALQRRLGLRRVAHLGFQAAQLGFHRHQLGQRIQALLPQRVRALQRRFLWQVADLQPAQSLQRAGRRLFQIQQDAQQGGLANPVWPDHRHARPMRQAEGDIRKDVHLAVRLGQAGSTDDRHSFPFKVYVIWRSTARAERQLYRVIIAPVFGP